MPLGPYELTAGELATVLEADRAGAPYVAYRADTGELVLQRLVTDSITVGRADENDIALAWDAEVSRAHARLERVAGRWTVVDDGLSRNGTFVGGERIRGRRALDPGALVRVGRTDARAAGRRAQRRRDRSRRQDGVEASRVTAAERRVLVALCRPAIGGGLATPASNQEIAEELVLSVAGVKTHLRALFDKLDVDDLPQNRKRAELARRALAIGLVGARRLRVELERFRVQPEVVEDVAARARVAPRDVELARVALGLERLELDDLAARDEVGHDDPRAALIVAEEVDVDGAAVLDERDAHAPAVGQRHVPRRHFAAGGQLSGRGARDLRGRREVAHPARSPPAAGRSCAKPACGARPAIGGDRVGPALGRGRRGRSATTPTVAPGTTASASRSPARAGSAAAKRCTSAVATCGCERTTWKICASRRRRTCRTSSPRAPRTVQARMAPSRGTTSVRPGSSVCRTVHAGEAPVGAASRQSRPSTPSASSALPSAMCPGGSGRPRGPVGVARDERDERRATASATTGRASRERRRAHAPAAARGGRAAVHASAPSGRSASRAGAAARRGRPAPAEAASSAATKLVASAYRSLRASFARPRSSTASTAGGSSGRRSLAGGTGASTCANRIAASVRRGNGTSPVSSS